jgi:phospholipid/cholesterol/gamma-HCH transport system permease protein
MLDRAGAGLLGFWRDAVALLDFFGRTLTVLWRLIAQPKHVRWTSIVHVMEVAGLNAVPIVMLLSFFVGLVVAYLGARIFGDFGVSVFTVELVAFSMLREFAAVITAVILAGRSNSAFTAEIGAMKMRQEIDAMRVMGLEPISVLVAPRVIAMLIMAPLLTFCAMMAGLVGGLLVCWGELGVSPVMFWSRIEEAVPAQHFWAGMVKSPFFAVALTIVACRHGTEVGGMWRHLARAPHPQSCRRSSSRSLSMRCLRFGFWRWGGERSDRHFRARACHALWRTSRA